MTEMILTLENDSMIPSLKKVLGAMRGVLKITTKRDNKTAAKAKKVEAKTDSKTEAFIKEFCGKSPDPRSADEIIADIYSSRINKDETFIDNAFK